MPGGGDTVGGGVQETDDGRGTFVLGTTEGAGSVQGVRGRDGAWVSGGAHADTAWEGKGENTELGSHGHHEETADVPDGPPDCGSNADLLV